MTLDQNQKDLVTALRHISSELAAYVEGRFDAGESFDKVQSDLRQAVKTVDGYRIGRNV